MAEQTDEVVIVEYNPQWVLLFEQEAARVREVLDRNLVTRVEHFGSTAVPDREAYTTGKAEYIETVMQKARQQPAS